MMGKHFNFVVISLSWLVALLSTASSQAQYWHLVDSLAYSTPASICSNSNNGVYVAAKSGTLLKLSQYGDTLRTYQPTGQEAPLLLPWQMLRIQAFFPFQQKLVLLDQNLNEVTSIVLPENAVGNATLSADQQVWYISVDLFLKKYNPTLEDNTVSTSLQWFSITAGQILLLREYQNRLYIQTNEELLVFDLFGNFLSKLQLKSDDIVTFFGNELYFTSNKEIHFIDLYTSATHKKPLPMGKFFSKILVEKEHIHGFTDRFWYVYANTDQAQK